MAIKTVSSVDELERVDARFGRKPNGRLKSNFSSQAEDPASRFREHDRYLEQMRQDGMAWRREGNFGAAQRAENQVAWEKADRESTHASRSRDRTSDPTIKERYNERMLESDSNADLAEQRQFQSDAQHESRWDELHSKEQQVRDEQAHRDREYQRVADDPQKPLRERLRPDELAKYERVRAEYGQSMQGYVKQIGRTGDIVDQLGESESFDRRYSAHLIEQQEARLSDRETQRERGDEPTAQKSTPAATEARDALRTPVKPPPSEQPAAAEHQKEMPTQAQVSGQAGKEELDKPEATPELHADDGKKHAPLLKAHDGYRAEISEDQTSIRYLREKDGGLGFTDRGNRVSVATDANKSDPDVMRAALMHASEKFATFKVIGTREHQEASARMAERLGIGDKLTNPDLMDIVRQEREQIARESAEKAIRVARAPQQEQVDSQAQQSPLERSHREEREQLQQEHDEEVSRMVEAHSDWHEMLHDGSSRSEEMPSDVERRQKESRASLRQEHEGATRSLERRHAAEKPAKPRADVSSLPLQAEVPTTQEASRQAPGMPTREVMKPPGYDERQALADSTSQQEGGGESAVAKPTTETPDTQTQRAHTQRQK